MMPQAVATSRALGLASSGTGHLLHQSNNLLACKSARPQLKLRPKFSSTSALKTLSPGRSVIQQCCRSMTSRGLLMALGYPKAQQFNTSDTHAFRALVVWLENTKIRQYPVEDRQALGDVQNPAWQDTCSEYLHDVDCPLSLRPDGSDTQAVLQWLINYAVSLEYADAAEQYNATSLKLQLQQQAAKQQQQQEEEGQRGRGRTAHCRQQVQPFPDLHDPQVSQGLSALFKLLHVDTSAGGMLEHLQAAKDVLRDSVLPSLTDASVQHALSSNSLDSSMLGFETGDTRVDRLATVLRLLYIRDLRDLQTAIDRMLVEVQEYTANPQTDSSLGKVGR